jgi:hypothetical protein
VRTLLAGCAFAVLGFAATPASAMPFPPLADAPSALTLVRQGCGFGFHRGPWGGCRPNAGVYYARPYPGPYRWGPHCWWRGGVRVCN